MQMSLSSHLFLPPVFSYGAALFDHGKKRAVMQTDKKKKDSGDFLSEEWLTQQVEVRKIKQNTFTPGVNQSADS